MRTEREHQIGPSYKLYWEIHSRNKYNDSLTVKAHGRRYRGDPKGMEQMSKQVQRLRDNPDCWKIVVVQSEPTYHWVRGEV